MARLIEIVSAAILEGKRDFHARFINLSYRYRGNVARNQTHIIAIATLPILLKNRASPKLVNIHVIDLKKIILAYSDIKIRAN